MRVAVFGLGYVGTVTAACLASKGHEVWAVDPVPTKVDQVSQGSSPVVEPGLDDLIATAVESGSLHATTDPATAMRGAEISLLCVGTPSSPDGSTDLGWLLRAVKEIGQRLRVDAAAHPASFHSVVIRSTVPPGTTEMRVIPVLEAEVGRWLGSGFGVAMCPEFLREGSGVADFFAPPFTVLGTADTRVAEAVERLFAFQGRTLQIVAVSTSEGLKYACNAFHVVNVSFANELARLYRSLDVDMRSVMDIFCQDHQLKISERYLQPGFAFGGSCLPKDLRSLLYAGRMNSVELPLLTGTLISNELAVRDVVRRITSNGFRKVALLGLSFKTQTDELRESPSVDLAETLIGKGLTVRIFDPVIQPSRLLGTNLHYVQSKLPHLQQLLTDSPSDALQAAEVAVVSSSADSVIEALVGSPPRSVIDLTGHLGREVEALPGYQGAGW